MSKLKDPLNHNQSDSLSDGATSLIDKIDQENQKVNESDFKHYHYLVTGDGLIVKGKYPVDANKICKTDSKGNALYAAHCGGGNTGAIGVSMCGMAGFKNSKQVGNYPLKKFKSKLVFS